MVGHTGSIPATIIGVQTIDECLRDVVQAVRAAGGVCVITADHGNAGRCSKSMAKPSTAHTLNPVPLIVTVDGARLRPRAHWRMSRPPCWRCSASSSRRP